MFDGAYRADNVCANEVICIHSQVVSEYPL